MNILKRVSRLRNNRAKLLFNQAFLYATSELQNSSKAILQAKAPSPINPKTINTHLIFGSRSTSKFNVCYLNITQNLKDFSTNDGENKFKSCDNLTDDAIKKMHEFSILHPTNKNIKQQNDRNVRSVGERKTKEIENTLSINQVQEKVLKSEQIIPNAKQIIGPESEVKSHIKMSDGKENRKIGSLATSGMNTNKFNCDGNETIPKKNIELQKTDDPCKILSKPLKLKECNLNVEQQKATDGICNQSINVPPSKNVEKAISSTDLSNKTTKQNCCCSNVEQKKIPSVGDTNSVNFKPLDVQNSGKFEKTISPDDPCHKKEKSTCCCTNIKENKLQSAGPKKSVETSKLAGNETTQTPKTSPCCDSKIVKTNNNSISETPQNNSISETPQNNSSFLMKLIKSIIEKINPKK